MVPQQVGNDAEQTTVCTAHRVTTCLENLEMSPGEFDREMSGILLKIREMSGNCQGKNLVREKLPINCLLQAAYLSPYRYLVGVCCVLNVKYMVSVHCTVAFLPPPLTVTLVYE